MKRSADQELAHSLLQEWSSGFKADLADGYGFPPAPTQRGCQNDHSATTVPERYAHDLHRWGTLQSAVAAVSRQSGFHGQLLWDHYKQGLSVQRLSDLAQISQSSCYERLEHARLMFLWAYHGLRDG